MSLKDLDLNSRLYLCEISKTSVLIFSEISKPIWIKFRILPQHWCVEAQAKVILHDWYSRERTLPS